MNMLRLESYLSPFLLSYLSKYIKDIEPQNLQFSLWGGDAVLHNVKFKLDALDNELFGAPFSFVSCQAQELKMHVPWSKLASEAVVITLNTVECVLKLQCSKPEKKPTREETKPATQPQPSYVDGLITKIKNNINIVVNNLILKYIEDDLVLSVNIQTAKYHSVDETWQSAFIDLSEGSPFLRRIFEIKDMTVCLDKRGTSGRVESFEDPMLFRCHIIMRQHSTYPSHTSRKPSATKYDFMIERYDLTISETQLPAFLRLLQLCLHIYYGTILITRTQIMDSNTNDQGDENQQGWASWAWSYVPAIVNYDELDEVSVRNPIIAFGLYIKNVVVSFKPSQPASATQMRRSRSSASEPILQMIAQGFSVELVARGLEFFSCDTTIAKCSMYCSKGAHAVARQNLTNVQDEFGDNSILLGYASGSMLGFSANSLFDFRSPENNNVPFNYPLTKDAYFAEEAQNNPKAFIAKYLYIAADGRNQETAEEEDFNDYLRYIKLTDVSEWNNVRERSWKTFVVGGSESKILAGSHFVTCFDVLKRWAENHTFKTYPLAVKHHVKRPEKLDEMKILHFVPARNAVFQLQNFTIIFPALHLQPHSYKAKQFHRVNLLAKSSDTHPHVHTDMYGARLPCIAVYIPSCSFTMKQPMYAHHLAAYLSYFHSPPTKLMQTCNTCYSGKFESVQINLSSVNVDPAEETDMKCSGSVVSELKSFMLESYCLQGTEHWQDRLSMLHTQIKSFLNEILISTSPIQFEMVCHVLDSWLQLFQKGKDVDPVLDVCFLEQTFIASSDKFLLSLTGIIAECNNTFSNMSVATAVKNVNVNWHKVSGDLVSLAKTAGISDLTVGNSPSCDEKTNWLAVYLQIPFTDSENGCILVNMHQLHVSVVNELWKVASLLPNVVPKHLIPYLLDETTTNKSDTVQQQSYLGLKQKFVVQFRCRGIKVCVASKEHKRNDLASLPFENTPGLHLVLPETSVFTSGHKQVPIVPQLLVEGVQVNPYSEFGTFNFTMERAEVFTVLCDKVDQKCRTLHIAHAYSATCRLVVTPPKKETTVPNFAIHLDVEPIEIKVSQAQVEMLAKLSTLALTTIGSMQANCMVPSVVHKASNKDSAVHPSNVSDTPATTQMRDDSKSNLSALVNAEVPKKVSCTVWLQCTLSRFTFSVYSQTKSKTTLTVEDVSLSLDYQNVYLKLMSCCSGCRVHHLIKVDGDWNESDDLGILLTPIFAKLPVLVRTYKPTKLSHAKTESRETLQQRKFCEVTFTQALTADYQRHLQEESQDSLDVANSSVVANSDAATPPVNLRQCVSEVICSIQAFDFLICPEIIAGLLPVFTPLLGMFGVLNQAKKQTTVKKTKSLEMPVLYFMLAGARIFLPSATTKSSLDDVLIVCLSKLEVNPHPPNPLTRLVLAPAIYKKAGTSGLLQSVGSALEDKQLELSLDDISVGTTNWSEVSTYLKQPMPYENPALQWNMAGKVGPQIDPLFHPILQEFDFQITVAPSIWYRNKQQKWIIMCAPSFEASFASDVVLHVTKMQLDAVTNLFADWTHMYIATFQMDTAILLSPREHETPGDSGLSVGSASHVTEKPVVPTTVGLVGDGLVAAHNVKILVYQYLVDAQSTKVKPMCVLEMFEPSMVVHVSRTQQKLEFQFHDVAMNLADENSQDICASDKDLKFPLSFIETKSGDNDKRTGVPPSLCTINVQHFLTTKASIKAKIGRPVKISLQSALFCVLKDLQSFVVTQKSSITSVVEPAVGTESLLTQIPAFSLETKQIVIEIIGSESILRGSISDVKANSQVTSHKVSGSAMVSNASVRIKTSDSEFKPMLYPVTLHANFCANVVRNMQQTLFNVLLNLSPTNMSVSKSILSCVTNLQRSVQTWVNSLQQETPNSSPRRVPAVATEFDDKTVCVTSLDDLRTGNYTYVVANEQTPVANQIVFSNEPNMCSMAWCYEKPHAIKHVYITPIPFNTSESDVINCRLECFNETKSAFEVVQKFQLSESKHVDFTLFDDSTPFHQVLCSCQWRVMIDSTNTSTVSPMSLAAAMQVESMFNTRFVPNFTLQLLTDDIELTLSDDEIQCIRFKVQSLDASARLWFHDDDMLSVVNSSIVCSLDVIDFTNLTWLPVLQPNSFQVKIKKDVDSVDCHCVCDDITELNVSQKILHAYSYIQEELLGSQASPMQKSCITLCNNTLETLVFGQALTDEYLTLVPKSTVNYYWRTHKVDLKLHVTTEGIPDWNWTNSFSIAKQDSFSLDIDQSKSVIVSVEKQNAAKTCVDFHGQTRLVNRLPIEIQCQLLFTNDHREDYTVPADCKVEILSSLDAVSSVSFKVPKTNYDPMKLIVADLLKTNGNTMSMYFPNLEKEVLHSQVCYHKSQLVDVLVLMPHFMVRSHLPKPAYLHVDTRSKQATTSIKLAGGGNEIPLLQLPPNTTHHLTVQLNENQSPFDAKVPIHSSLVYSMDETHYLDKPLCTLQNYYPYNTPSYEGTGNDPWSAGDGNIHANLSMYANSLLIEITPWCLVVNDTSEVICIVSQENGTSIIQPGDVTVPHHFTGPFHIRTSNSSCSQKLLLHDDVHTDHPARMNSLQAGHILSESIHSIYLKKQNMLLDFTLKSCVRHGIRILTISSTWWFINMSTSRPHILVKGCANQQDEIMSERSTAVEINTTSPVPLLAWQVEASVNEESSDELESPTPVVASPEETSSSFICVDNGGSDSRMEMLLADRCVAFFVNGQTAVVSVGDDFSKRLADFYSKEKDGGNSQMIVTKHSEDEHYFIVLNDATHCRYQVENLTTSSFCFSEVTDHKSSVLNYTVPPGGCVPFESYMDAESFPKCRRIYRSINLLFSAPDERGCVSVLIPDIEYKTEINIPGLGTRPIQVSRQHGSILLQVKTDTKDREETADREEGQKSFNCHLNIKDCKIVLLDDVNNQNQRTDVVHVCFHDVMFKAVSDPLSKAWYVQFSVGDFQMDNQLFAVPEFPVFMWSCLPYTSSSIEKALLVDLTLTDKLHLDTIDVHTGAVQLKLESILAKVLSSLLQSYVDSTHLGTSASTATGDTFSASVRNEAALFRNPLRFTTLTIHPFVLLLSLRADVKLYVSVDRGAISFSKFVCCDLDTTTNELIQEITRHYVADAVYGAGWILGSLDILGNPATTLRSFMQGVTDLVLLPYQGLTKGPTAFIGGFAQGVSSLLKHFSSGTLRSITNIATGISRNLGPTPDVMQQSALDSGEIGILLKHGNKRNKEERQGYVGGIGKAIVHVMTRPIGGAAGMVSKAGESILRKAGLEIYKQRKYSAASTQSSLCQSSLTKFTSKVVESDVQSPASVVAILNAKMLSVDIKVVLALTESSLFTVRQEDETIENSLPIKDIEIFLEEESAKQQTKNVVLVIQRATSVAVEKRSVYKEKVAEYLGVEEELKHRQEEESKDIVKYSAEVTSHSLAMTFCSLFDKIKPKPNRFQW
uniref:Vacuolar protein sorting-associated protein 13B-like n=1 Tax=Phallusia mammillata TaxID=59560 RepID=A0A6F9DW26_9ASCI|nr:vacuolar protein sorting-associated protein 13B-like [Phallusia mammillata]